MNCEQTKLIRLLRLRHSSTEIRLGQKNGAIEGLGWHSVRLLEVGVQERNSFDQMPVSWYDHETVGDASSIPNAGSSPARRGVDCGSPLLGGWIAILTYLRKFHIYSSLSSDRNRGHGVSRGRACPQVVSCEVSAARLASIKRVLVSGTYFILIHTAKVLWLSSAG